MATVLEQFLIEDRLFRHYSNETVNAYGDGASESTYNTTKCNQSEEIEQFEQQKEDVWSLDTANSSNTGKNQVFVDERERPITFKIDEMNQSEDAAYGSKDQVSHAIDRSKLYCHANHKCRHDNHTGWHANRSGCHGVGGKSSIDARNCPRVQSSEAVDVDLDVHGVNDEFLNEVKRGTTSISLVSRKRHNTNVPAAENSAKKIQRMNSDAAEHFTTENNESLLEQTDVSSSSLPFKSRASRYLSKLNAYKKLNALNRNRIRRSFFKPNWRNFHSRGYADKLTGQRADELAEQSADQRAAHRQFIYGLI